MNLLTSIFPSISKPKNSFITHDALLLTHNNIVEDFTSLSVSCWTADWSQHKADNWHNAVAKTTKYRDCDCGDHKTIIIRSINYSLTSKKLCGSVFGSNSTRFFRSFPISFSTDFMIVAMRCYRVDVNPFTMWNRIIIGDLSLVALRTWCHLACSSRINLAHCNILREFRWASPT